MRWHHAVILKTSLSVHFFSLTLFVWFESSWKNLRFGGSLSFSPSFLVPSSCLDSGVGHQGMWPWNDIGNQGALDVCCNNCFCVVYPTQWRKVRCFLDFFGLEIGLESERFEDHGCGDRLEPEATQHDVNCMLSPVLPVLLKLEYLQKTKTSWDIWDIDWCFATWPIWWIHLKKPLIHSNGDKLRGILGAVFVSLLMVLYQAMCFPHVQNSSGFHLAPDTKPPTRKRHGIRFVSFQKAELMTTFSPSGMMMMMMMMMMPFIKVTKL